MGYVGPLGEKPSFFFSLGIAEFLGFSELSVYTEIVLLKTFPLHTLNYASTANIEEVMKFYNPGHKTFETDFNSYYTSFQLTEDGQIQYLTLDT